MPNSAPALQALIGLLWACFFTSQMGAKKGHPAYPLGCLRAVR